MHDPVTTPHILLVEDSDDDAELLRAGLVAAGLQPRTTRVDSLEEFAERLASEHWDIVISDFSLPGFTALDALQTAKRIAATVPFIILSGSVGEDVAVQAMKLGASDYFRKDGTKRLVAAIHREIREAQVRRGAARTQNWLELLSRAGSALAESLNFELTLKRVAEIAVSRYSDLCLIDFMGADEQLHRVAAAHADPTRQAELTHISERYPPRSQAGEPALQALKQRSAVAGLDVDVDEDSAFAAVARHFGARYGVAVPLVSSQGVIGVLSVASTQPYDAVDQQFLEDLGRRSAMALDNARLYRDAQQAIWARDDFIAVASHELNTPIAALQLHLEGLARGLQPGAPMDERATRKLEGALRSVTRLTTLVEHLLDVSRLSRGELDLRRQSVDLSELVQDVSTRIVDAAERAGCSLEIDAEQPAVGEWDRLRIEQVLSNLIANAIKFGAGKPIRVAVASDERTVRVSVSDEGIGIAAADHERIFQRFGRAATRRSYGGLGLGLFISREILRAHGGSLDVDSEPGRGSTFVAILPRSGYPAETDP
jgi:signal transduction histidine kinase